jgi:hypothetical protein
MVVTTRNVYFIVVEFIMGVAFFEDKINCLPTHFLDCRPANIKPTNFSRWP